MVALIAVIVPVGVLSAVTMTVVAIAVVVALIAVIVPIGVLSALPTLVVVVIIVFVAVSLGNNECASRLRIQHDGPLTLSLLRAVQGC